MFDDYKSLNYLLRQTDRHPFNGLFFQDNLGKPTSERLNQYKTRDNGVAVASAEPYVNYLHLAINRYA